MQVSAKAADESMRMASKNIDLFIILTFLFRAINFWVPRYLVTKFNYIYDVVNVNLLN